jgi:hypothetical protein
MPNVNIRPMVDALVTDRAGLPLVDWLADQRDAGHSWESITDALAQLTGGAVVLNRSTLLRWHKDRDKETAA